MATRRRTQNNEPEKGGYMRVEVSKMGDIRMEPQYPSLPGEGSDNDSDFEIPKELQLKTRKRNFVAQATIYCLVLVFLALFIYMINRYNAKQLEQLKEDYGMDLEMPAPEHWWGTALIYHIYTRSFKDSNNDGIGDLKGIMTKMDHLQYLAIDAVLLSCIFKSPMEDFGKDVSDFRAIDPVYGTMQDFETLVKELHKRDIRLVLELVPNHSSRRHPWFDASRGFKIGPDGHHHKDSYIWHEGKTLSNGTRQPPNNWMSYYGGSAWTWDNTRQQYYYHYYHSSMPDLNYRDPIVGQLMLETFEFWLGKGVDGLIIDGAHVLFEIDELTLDEPLTEIEGVHENSYNFVDHAYTEDQPDVHDFIASWHEYVDEFSLLQKKKIPLMVNAEDDVVLDVVKYYLTGADAPLCHVLSHMDRDCGGRCLYDKVSAWIDHLPDSKFTMWMLSSPDGDRLIHQKGAEYQGALNMLMLLMPGAAITYYGDEIGLRGPLLPYNRAQDLRAKRAGPLLYSNVTRDPARSPMQWTNQKFAGFSSEGVEPWMSVHDEFTDVNVKAQIEDHSGGSLLQLYSRLAGLRKQPSFSRGHMQFSVAGDNIFSFLRFAKDTPPYLVALNVGSETATEDFTVSAGVQFAKVVAHAVGLRADAANAEDSTVDLERLVLYPGEGVVVMLVMDLSPGEPIF